MIHINWECHKERPFLDLLAYDSNAYVSRSSGSYDIYRKK